MAETASELEMKKIDLGNYRETGIRVISGRPKGEYARKSEKLDEIASGVPVTFSVPEDIVIVNPSFFLGLVGKSVGQLGKEQFLNQFKIETKSDLVRSRWREAIERVSTEAHLRD